MSLGRKFTKNFIDDWQRLDDDEKCSNGEFKDLHSELSSNSLSMFKGSSDRRFATEISAANAISRGSVQDVNIVTLHSSSCFTIIENTGNTGISHIDNAHVNVGISIDELCKIFKDTSRTDMYDVSKNDIYEVLSEWYKENDQYKDVITRKFSETTVNKIANI